MRVEKRRKIQGSEWFEVSEEETRRYLSDYYTDVDACFEDLQNGQVVQTTFAYFRRMDDYEYGW
jgi:hypothetical protein